MEPIYATTGLMVGAFVFVFLGVTIFFGGNTCTVIVTSCLRRSVCVYKCVCVYMFAMCVRVIEATEIPGISKCIP